MNFESYIVDIKKLVRAINNKDEPVHITYRGFDLGQTQPWIIKCDSKEVAGNSPDVIARDLYLLLTEELKKKISVTENQAAQYRNSLDEILQKPGQEKKKLTANHEVSRRQEVTLS